MTINSKPMEIITEPPFFYLRKFGSEFMLDFAENSAELQDWCIRVNLNFKEVEMVVSQLKSIKL